MEFWEGRTFSLGSFSVCDDTQGRIVALVVGPLRLHQIHPQQQPDGNWRLSKPKMLWMEHWDQTDRMNEAVEEIIGRKPRLKETPFVFGGNMVVHREVFTHIPLDPNITRGEEIDFLINMRMFGYKFIRQSRLFCPSIRYQSLAFQDLTAIFQRPVCPLFGLRRAVLRFNKGKRV